MTPLDIALAAIRDNSLPDAASQLVCAKCIGLMCGYDARWSASEYKIDSVEKTVTANLWNPATNYKSRSFSIAGKIDVTARYRDHRVIFDHKTTSEEIADPGAPFWRQLVIEGQPSMYMLLEWLNQRKVDDAVWDVVRKPSITPRALYKAELTRLQSDGTYFEYTPSEASRMDVLTTARENNEFYSARLAYDCAKERPERYFQRRSVPRLDSEIHEFATELWEQSQEILHARIKNRHSRNSGACMAFHRPCMYLGICSGYDTPDSDNWKRKLQVHSELPILTGDGKNVLTVSRLKEFQLCRRRHFYRYEMGIERQRADDGEALYFGTLWHIGLEAYFLALKETQNGTADAEGIVLTASSTNSNERRIA